MLRAYDQTAEYEEKMDEIVGQALDPACWMDLCEDAITAGTQHEVPQGFAFAGSPIRLLLEANGIDKYHHWYPHLMNEVVEAMAGANMEVGIVFQGINYNHITTLHEVWVVLQSIADWKAEMEAA